MPPHRFAAILSGFMAAAASAGGATISTGTVVASTGTVAAAAVKADPNRLSIGVNDLGSQLRLRVTTNWAAEARFTTGSASSNEGTIHSLVFGARAYRFFHEHYRLKPYLGLEGDYAQTSIRSVASNASPTGGVSQFSGFGSTSGYAAGGFGGVELRVLKRVAIDVDMGPYLISLKEKVTGASAANWDFVINSAVNVYQF